MHHIADKCLSASSAFTVAIYALADKIGIEDGQDGIVFGMTVLALGLRIYHDVKKLKEK